MSRRFQIGAAGAAVINSTCAGILWASHELMEGQQSWRYMLEFLGWQTWSTWFFASGMIMLVGLVLGRSVLVRAGVGIGVVFFSMWTASLLLVPADPTTTAITGLIPLLTATPAFFGLIFLAIPANDWLDTIPFRRGHPVANGDASARGS